MASNPPGECCITGVEHNGDPSGKSIKVGSYDAYLATPVEANTFRKNCGILFIPDVIGIWKNSRLLADEFAAHGYTTLVIDIFEGDALTLNNLGNTDIPAWIKSGSQGTRGHTPAEIDPIVHTALDYLRGDLSCKRIGAVGYCFGGKYVVRGLKDSIDVGFVAHPSFVAEDELAAISGPLSIAAAEIDEIFTTEGRHRSEKILQASGHPYQITLYSQVAHGFAMRRGLDKKVERFGKRQALKQAVDFLDEWLPVSE